MKKTNQSAVGTSFHDTTIKATINQLKEVLGDPDLSDFNNLEDKVSHEWEMETEDREVFTVYDCKEYRTYSNDDEIEWHIGGKNGYITMKAKDEIEEALKLINQ